jgi:EAL and modified HD-GYP domain-containing signal transduction protein
MSSQQDVQSPDSVPSPLPLGTTESDGDSNAVIARQAIVDEKRAVYGYELFDRSTSGTGHTAASDAAMLFNALSYAGTEALVGKKTVFINCTHDSLAGGHLELISPDRVVLEVPPMTTEDVAVIEQRAVILKDLRDRGFRLAFPHHMLRRAYASWLPLASFIKIEMNTLKPELAEPLLKFARANTKAEMIAEKVETAEQFERMAGLGVKLFQGFWFAKPSLIKAKTIRPSQATIIQLINLVRKQADPGDIEDLLKKDPTLSFNLLRFINSAGFGLQVEITSFRHAVMMLGMKKLFRWAALLLTTSKDGAPPAVGSTAVVRGRLMELLCAELMPPEECDNAFIVGVFSLLDTMLGISLDKALETVSLPQSVVDALLHKQGVFWPFLELTTACETGDDAVFARVATELQLSNRQVNWAHLQALDWAESLND